MSGHKPAGLHKYRAIRTEYNGVSYPSKWEAECAKRLDLDPDVYCWFRQVKVPLGPDFSTVVDFLVVSSVRMSPPYFVEAKGPMTNRFRHVCRLWPKYAKLSLVIRRRNKPVEIVRTAADEASHQAAIEFDCAEGP
jgi:hypothetical protein